MSALSQRLVIQISGCVQGVGFRPFVYRLAKHYKLSGHIKNTSSGLHIDVQGALENLSAFQCDLVDRAPIGAVISEMSIDQVPLTSYSDFAIVDSECKDSTELALLPDTAMCKECLSELFDPQNRRYRYPFLHCMSCGPRFSLFLRMPFDRANTAMVDFKMCPSCQIEYADCSDRRFYSQTTCCPQCGPQLTLFDATQRPLTDPIETAALFLKEGKIVALKNTGGFLLLVDASNENAVLRLRERKRRPRKPFAVLVADIESAQAIAWIDEAEQAALLSPAAPIVLLQPRSYLSSSVSCGSPYCGVMLAHNALQHLLLDAVHRPLVATSGNASGEPICIDEEAAFEQLAGIADAFLVHNRKIMHRLDDSVVQIIDGSMSVVRRARGMIPFAIPIAECRSPILGAGAHLKNTFAIAKDRLLYLSQHIGDLESHRACMAYQKELQSWQQLLCIEPQISIGDRHVDYFTSRYLQKNFKQVIQVQHHEAHVHACMLDNRLQEPCLAICWDGTGLGDDQMIWGAESFVVDEGQMRRFATLAPFRLPGGDKAAREPRRSLLGVLHALRGSQMCCGEEFQLLFQALEKQIYAPLCSSMGRLFDAVSALLGLCSVCSFEAEAALELECQAALAQEKILQCHFHLEKQGDLWVIVWKEVIEILEKPGSVMERAFAFHRALAELIVKLARQSGMRRVLLTGGCMQNKLLVELAITALRKEGFEPFWHRQIPANDGGLSVGQVIGANGYF